MVDLARSWIGSYAVLAGLLLGAGACADDGAGITGGTTATSSGGTSSSTTDPGSTGPGATGIATGADTTAGVASTGGTTTGGTSTGGSTGTAGSDGSSSSGSTTGDATTTGSSSSGGPGCGDGILQPGEQCDGADLQGFDCASLGLGVGVLACDPVACTFDATNCGPPGSCGNGAIGPGEQCDGADLQGFDCASLGLGGGVLGCDPITCTFDTSMCMPGSSGTSG